MKTLEKALVNLISKESQLAPSYRAWMPVSSAMDGNFSIPLHHYLGAVSEIASHPCDWIPASMPE